jgi:glycerol-3-phosphate cytidylyltransferase
MIVGITFGSFDLLHAGHVSMLQECKRQCDILIVGLQTDPTIDRPKEKNKPIQSVFERYEQLKACKYIDEILVYETEDDLVNILLSYPINVRILGQEYEHKDFTGRYECTARDINFYFNKREHNFSTTELRQRVVAAEINKGLKE